MGCLRSSGRSLALGLCAAFGVACGYAVPPNIVLLIGDDHGFTDFGFMGAPYVQTPELDALAATGTVFRDGYTTASECRPSLMSLLTGLYPYQWSFRVRELERTGRNADGFPIRHFDTLPRLLAARGYASFQGGKYWEGSFAEAGFTEGMTAEYDPDVPWGGAGIALGRETMQPVYDFIDTHAREPFFIWFAPMLPHIPHRPPERFLSLYDDRGLSRTAQRYYASCSWYDSLVGELVRHLELRGLRERTLIVYVSDNGWQQPPFVDYRSRLGAYLGGAKGKASLHGPGFRTPILFSWPGHVAEGRGVDGLVSTVDVMPTLLDYAGVEIPEWMPGSSLRAALEGGDRPARELLVGSVERVRPTQLPPNHRALTTEECAFWARSRTWHFIRHEDTGTQELYDLATDPGEERDVAAQHPAVVAELAAAIDAWRREVLSPFAAEGSLPLDSRELCAAGSH